MRIPRTGSIVPVLLLMAILLAVGSGVGAVIGMADRELHGTSATTVMAIVGVLGGLVIVGLLVLTVVMARLRPFAAVGVRDDAAIRQLRAAVRQGRAPDDPALDDDALALAAYRHKNARWARRYLPWLYGAFALLNLVNALLGEESGWLLCAGFLLMGIGFWAALRQEHGRLQRMEAAVRARG
jgi:hypothetical protein